MTRTTWNFTANSAQPIRVGQQVVVNEEGHVVGTAPTTPPRQYTYHYAGTVSPFLVGVEGPRQVVGVVWSSNWPGDTASIDFRGTDYAPRYPRTITRRVVSTSVHPDLDAATWGRIGNGAIIAHKDFTPSIAVNSGDHVNITWTFHTGHADIRDPSILIGSPAATEHSRLLGIEIVEDHSVPQGTFWVTQGSDLIRVRAESMGSLLTSAPAPRAYTWNEPPQEDKKEKRKKAEERARDLLLSHLSEDQRKMFVECGYFDVYVGKEKKYRVCNSRTANVEVWTCEELPSYLDPRDNSPSFPLPATPGYLYNRMIRSSAPARAIEKEGEKEWRRGRRYCAVSDYHAPVCDQLLAQKLLLETNEQHFLGVAL